MPNLDVRTLRNPYADLFREPRYPSRTKVETASEATAYELERGGAKSETSTSININRGELEQSSGNKGDYYRFSVAIVTATDSYYAVVDFVDNGAGPYAATPILDDVDALSVGQFDPASLYETGPGGPVYESAYSLDDLLSWQDGAPPVETAPDYTAYDPSSGSGASSGGGYYQPETGQAFVPPPVEQEQQPVEEVQQNTYEQEYQEYLYQQAQQDLQNPIYDYYSDNQ